MKKDEQAWLPLDKAVESLGRSQATFYRFVRAGEIRSMQVPRPNRKPETLFSVEDIARIRDESLKSTELVPVRNSRPNLPALRQLPAATPMPANRPVLRIEEAAAEFGLPSSYLAELVHTGAIAAVKRGAWYVSRKSLEHFIDNGFSQSSQRSNQAEKMRV